MYQNSVINSNNEWARACRVSSATSWLGLPQSDTLAAGNFMDMALSMGLFFLVMILAWSGSHMYKRYRRGNYIRLGNEEVSTSRIIEEFIGRY